MDRGRWCPGSRGSGSEHPERTASRGEGREGHRRLFIQPRGRHSFSAAWLPWMQVQVSRVGFDCPAETVMRSLNPTGVPGRRISWPERIAFLLLTISAGAFVAQGAVAYWAAPFEAAVHAPPQVLLLGVAFLSLLLDPRNARWIFLGRHGRLCLAGGVAIIAIDGFRHLLGLGEWNGLRTAQILTGIVIYVISVRLVPHELWMRRLLRVVFLVVCASALVAIFELFAGINVPWSVYAWRGRNIAVGLEYHPVALAYAMVPPSALAAFFAVSRDRPYGDPGRQLSRLTAVLGTVALVGTASRSGLAGLVGGLVAGMLVYGRDVFSRLVLYGVPVLGALVFVGPIIIERVSKGDITADPRIYATWVTYLPMVLMHPFGVPHDVALGDLAARAHRFFGLDPDPFLVANALSIAPHNAFLSVGVQYGWVGAVVVLVMYVHALRQASALSRLRSIPDGSRVLAAGILSATIALLVHMSFHNASIVMGEMRNWLYLGLLIGLCEMSRRRLLTPIPDCPRLAVHQEHAVANAGKPGRWSHA